MPRRWVVERTFAWISHNRRMGKDHERLCTSGEAFVYAATTCLMVKRSARARWFSGGLGAYVLGRFRPLLRACLWEHARADCGAQE